MDKFSDDSIIKSWAKNASPWVTAVQKQQIESRKLVTDHAIINTIAALPSVNSVLDIGCGEGWLCRKLSTMGFNVMGIDATPALINNARKHDNGRYEVLAYEDVSSHTVSSTFDVAVCNFALLGKESVAALFKAIPPLLNDKAYLVIQTLHPISSCGEAEYEDGWREGSWAGFNEDFCDPAPWYFRTIESWRALFLDNGFILAPLTEPVSPSTGIAASLIMTGRKR